MDFPAQLLRFGRIVGIRHALCEFGQLVAGQLTIARQLKSEPEHKRLFRARQLLDLFDDAACCHGVPIADGAVAFKRKCRAIFTIDRQDFSIYRRFRIKGVPAVFPD